MKSKVWDFKSWNAKHIKLVFFIYIAIVIKVIIFKYPWENLMAIAGTWRRGIVLEGLDTANFTLFKTIRMYIDYSYMLNSFENLVGNVVVFIPFGFLLPYVKESCKRFWVLFLNTFIFVLGIEVFQLFSAFGAFDVDDILLNCFGAMLGWIAYVKWESILGNIERKRQKHN
ncbi:MAG: VanZ family protein [Clostridiales bacterium]|nr:VanZ family protein [Clostridiales bacterium]